MTVHPTDTAAASEEPRLVGTWKLVRFEDIAADGAVTHPYGPHPLGTIIYDAAGQLSVNIMRNPPPPPFASANLTDAEKAAAWDAYAGYFGTWRVDKANRVLHHRVEGAWNPSWVGTDQIRPYKLDGDKLIIDLIDPPGGTRYVREFRRAR